MPSPGRATSSGREGRNHSSAASRARAQRGSVARATSRGRLIPFGRRPGASVEHEERMIADGFEVAVVRGLLLRAVNWALGAVDVEDHPPRGRACRRMLNEVRVQASQSMVVRLLCQDISLVTTRPRPGTPAAIQDWSLTSLQHRLLKTGGRLIRHARYFTLQLAESHLTGPLFRQILRRIERLAWHPT
jgi:hypothetical protein